MTKTRALKEHDVMTQIIRKTQQQDIFEPSKKSYAGRWSWSANSEIIIV